MTFESVRTPDAAFANLPDFPFQPNYVEDLPGYEGLRAHYLDEGPREASHTFLCLHGEPTWSFLYRKMIPVFTAAGHRVVAPDFFGFGRSDKPIEDSVYTFDFHREYLKRFVEHLDLKNVTLVVQDWGGLLGLTLPMDDPERFQRMIVMNTTLAVGELPSEGFANWKAFAATNPDLDVGGLMKRGTSVLSDTESAAYGAPFPDERSKAGVRRFPEMVMIEPSMEGTETSIAAREFFHTQWSGATFMAVGLQDPVLGLPVMEQLKSDIKGSSDLMQIEDAGHFTQEWGGPIAQAALDYFETVS